MEQIIKLYIIFCESFICLRLIPSVAPSWHFSLVCPNKALTTDYLSYLPHGFMHVVTFWHVSCSLYYCNLSSTITPTLFSLKNRIPQHPLPDNFLWIPKPSLFKPKIHLFLDTLTSFPWCPLHPDATTHHLNGSHLDTSLLPPATSPRTPTSSSPPPLLASQQVFTPQMSFVEVPLCLPRGRWDRALWLRI